MDSDGATRGNADDSCMVKLRGDVMTIGIRAIGQKRYSSSLFTAFFLALLSGPIGGPPAIAQTEALPPAETPTKAAAPLSFALLAEIGSRDVDESVAAFYEARGYAPIWLDTDGLQERGHLTLAAFAAANDHALNPDNYGPLLFAERLDAAQSDEDWAALELDLTAQFIRYATHLSSGRVQPNEINKALNIFPHVPEPVDLLTQANESVDFSAFLEALSPNTPNYARLKRRLAQYRDKAALGGFTVIPDGEVLKPGMEDDRTTLLRQRLAEEDYMLATDHSGTVYDGALVEAVKEFQEYHGLSVDGVIGKNTLAEINVPIRQKLIQMELNMERRRWMPDFLGDTYVFVNLADQNLKLVKNGKTWHTTRVVVGKPYHATPVFSDEMTYVEINPYWNVPYSIATKEYLPKLRQNPNALSAQNIRIFSGEQEVAPTQVAWNYYSGSNFPFKLRQDPGGRNALGRIKFMFPNQFNIYIHDTPSKTLFDRAQRDFSHGCIRVSDPFALGDVLLSDQGYDRAKLEAIRDAGARKVVKLEEPVQVHLTYLTAWMNKDGSTHFRRDIYDRDEVLLKAMARAMTENL
ncbi:L,D-transpeptidase family protein [Roseibium polysiphoniae]|uniref:L,D-transpeptidase family protein n=1 Tax=Roseibium polysiphoniae TaxID=2571221 RepID=UPI00329A613F